MKSCFLFPFIFFHVIRWQRWQCRHHSLSASKSNSSFWSFCSFAILLCFFFLCETSMKKIKFEVKIFRASSFASPRRKNSQFIKAMENYSKSSNQNILLSRWKEIFGLFCTRISLINIKEDESHFKNRWHFVQD